MLAFLRAALVVGFLTIIAGTAGCPGCSGSKPPISGGHSSCMDASNHRASLGCKFQDGFYARCSEIGSIDFNDCVVSKTGCAQIDQCDPANQTK